jgi:hypothetical protein
MPMTREHPTPDASALETRNPRWRALPDQLLTPGIHLVNIMDNSDNA